MQEVCFALAFALLRAGNSIAASMAMMAMTTSNSIRVKPNVLRNGTTEAGRVSRLPSFAEPKEGGQFLQPGNILIQNINSCVDCAQTGLLNLNPIEFHRRTGSGNRVGRWCCAGDGGPRSRNIGGLQQRARRPVEGQSAAGNVGGQGHIEIG